MASSTSMAPPRADSNLEVKSLLHQPPVLRFVEPIESGGAVGDVLFDFISLNQKCHSEQLFPEVALVERALQDRLVQVLQLREREPFGEQFEADRLVADLALQPC